MGQRTEEKSAKSEENKANVRVPMPGKWQKRVRYGSQTAVETFPSGCGRANLGLVGDVFWPVRHHARRFISKVGQFGKLWVK